MIELTDEEKSTFKAIHRQLKNGKDRDKIKAILLLADGYKVVEVSRILLINEDTIRNWRQKYEDCNYCTDWIANEYEGYSGKLTVVQEQQVSLFVARNVVTDSKQVIDFIRTNFNKDYSLSGIISLLHRLKFTYKKTTLIPSKYDAEKQAEFKKEYEKQEKELSTDEAIVFLDGVHPQHNTACTNAWIKVGEEKQIKSNTGRTRINIHGAYNPINQDVVIQEDKTLNYEATINFLKKLEETYHDKKVIFAYADNAPYYKNQFVTEYLKTSRIELIFLPTYSPNLNLIERLWKLMRKEVINNRYYEKFKEFRMAIMNFFEECKDNREEIKKFIGSRLHLLEASLKPKTISGWVYSRNYFK